jgi:hypothetical protein
VPRWISATCGSVAEAGVKSEASQPLWEVLAVAPGGITMSFVATSVPVTSPVSE